MKVIMKVNYRAHKRALRRERGLKKKRVTGQNAWEDTVTVQFHITAIIYSQGQV